jgi:hypothetical protein
MTKNNRFIGKIRTFILFLCGIVTDDRPMTIKYEGKK